VIDSGASAAWRVHLSALLFSLVGFLLAGAGLTTALTAAATSAAVVLVCLTVVVAAIAVAVPQVPQGRVRTALRDRELRTAFLPQRDPDAAGRPRPRAPGRRIATAA
jgi:uncharacterized protein DUF6412